MTVLHSYKTNLGWMIALNERAKQGDIVNCGNRSWVIRGVETFRIRNPPLPWAFLLGDSAPAGFREAAARVIVISTGLLNGPTGAPLIQYELRCPHCGAEQPWNLYSQADLPTSLECPACEDGYETAPMRLVSFFEQLPAQPVD